MTLQFGIFEQGRALLTEEPGVQLVQRQSQAEIEARGWQA